MLISVVGPGSHAFLHTLRGHGIECTPLVIEPQRGLLSQAGGQMLRITQKTIPFDVIASVLIAWMEHRRSRRIMLTNDNGQVVHMLDMTEEEVEYTLRSTSQIDILDIRHRS